MRARRVSAMLTPSAWPLVAQWVKGSLVKGKADIGPEDVRRALATGAMQLWLAWDDVAKCARGCCVTELADSVRGKYCNLVVIAGHDFASWRPLTEVIKRWARSTGCVRLEAGGREGWQRLVKADGWRTARTVIEMRLDDG
jgi:hypothetical protein